MATALVFRTDEGTTIRVPDELELSEGEVEMFRRGDELVVKSPRSYGEQLIEIIRSMSEEMFEGIKDDRPPEEREGL